MARFWYTTDEGDGLPRYLEADNLPQALLTLRRRGTTVKSAGEYQAPLPFTGTVNEQSLIPVYEQIAALLEQGTELTVALHRTAAETTDRRIEHSLVLLADRVAQGYTFSEAMAQQPAIFAPLVISTVAAAETSGDLTEGLRSLGRHQRDLQQLGSDLALPLAYPVFLLFVIVGLTVFLGAAVWPRFTRLYVELGMTPGDWPALSLLMDRALACLRIAGPPVLILLGVLAIFYHVRVQVRAGGLHVRPLGLPVPLFGRLAMYGALARAAGALRLQLGHGARLGPALRLAGEASGNGHVSLAMRRAEETVSQGGRLSHGLRDTGLLPDTFVHSLAAAETSGDFLQTLEHVETEYTDRVKSLARHWVILAGPIVVVILGMVVGLLGVSMYAPLVRIISQLSQN
ncbi:MAG: type II secretion system F family protein [Armatimonadota bacterium]